MKLLRNFNQLTKKEEEANEDTPLKANDKDIEAGDGTDICETKENEKAVMASVDEKTSDDKQSSSHLLDQHKVKLILAILGAVLLVLLLLIVAILVIIYRDGVSASLDFTLSLLCVVPCS